MRKEIFGWKFTGWTGIAFYAVCGLLLLLWPNLALTIANYALAAVLCVMGIVLVIEYLRAEKMERAQGLGLTKGLILLLVGLVLLVKSQLLITVLPFLWGVAMVIGGFAKVQMAFDLRGFDRKQWWLMLLGALLSFVLGIFAVTQPVFLANVITQFMGISLLVEAVLDAVALFVFHKEFKNMKA
ncbi:MAG: DUF308 domain-containing protein [Eubacteriales bacterium]|nr:DUF308 domain-containing protein [Eubacteriales bacterium]